MSLPPQTLTSIPKNKLLILAIVVLWSVVYLPGLFRPALLDDADSVHAEAAREILTCGDWVTLHANGIRYLEKAPLLYWGMATSFKAFGIGEWSARLPLAVSVLAALLAVYALGKRAFGATGGFYAAAVMGTSFGIFIFTRILIPDVMVGLWLTLGLYFFLQALDEKQPTHFTCAAFAATVALNVLTKGLIGIVFPAGIIGLYLIAIKDPGFARRFRWLTASIVFLAITAPWHVLAALRTPDQGAIRGWAWFYFMNEHFLRYLGKRVPVDYDKVPLLLFWGLLLVWLLPWCGFIAQGLKEVPHRRGEFRKGLNQRQKANLLFGIWAFVILFFFSFSTRQEYYVLPAVPALALLIAGWLARETESPAASPMRRSGRITSGVMFGIGALLFAVCAALAAMSRVPPPGYDLADLLRQQPGLYALSFGHFFDLTKDAMGAFRTQLLAFGIALMLGTGANFWLRKQGKAFQGNIALVLMAVVMLSASHQALTIFEPVLSSRQLALAIEKRYQPGDVILINGEYEEGSTLNFYTRQQVQILNGRRSNLWYGSFFSDAPPIFHDDASFERLWQSDQRVYLWTEENRLPAYLKQDGVAAIAVAKSGGKFILTNHPLP